MVWATRILLIVLAVGLIVYDIVVATNRQTGDTISEVIQYWSMCHPIFAYAYGILGGHFFWPGPSLLTAHITNWQALAITLGTGVVIALLDLIHLKTGWWVVDFMEKWPITVMLLAVPIGHICWAQARPIL